jgi:hypothetical protein
MTTQAKAQKLQAAAVKANDVLIWTICKHPSDYPDQFTARPHSVRMQCHCAFVLSGDTLDEVRDLLPTGLYQLHIQPGDDPVIAEIWL